MAETIDDVNGWKQEALSVLTGFIANLGQPFIIDPARDTLMNIEILKIDTINGYALRNETREKIPL